MSAHRNDISATARMQLAGQLVGYPEENRSEVARQMGLSRPSLYAIEKKGRQALKQSFDPAAAPASPGQQGYWLWVDANAVKRLVVTLRAVLGASLSAIVLVLVEAFGLRMSEGSVREIVAQGYQRGFDYQQGVRLEPVVRVAFDEMYRWRRCILTGVDCDSLFILLGEKQSGCSKDTWSAVMERLREQQGLEPEQVAIDGLSALAGAAGDTWPGARLVHDIAHANIVMRKVRGQFEQRAYRAIEAAEVMKKRHERGPTRKTSQEQLEHKLAEARAAEESAIEQAELAAGLVAEAHAALAVIDPLTGCLNEPLWSAARLIAVSEQFQSLDTTQARWAASYLCGPAQKMIEERAEFGDVLRQLVEAEHVSFACAEVAAWLWQLEKQHATASWSGTRKALEGQMQLLWQDLREALGPEKAARLIGKVFRAFGEVLAASSPIEWANEQLSSVLPAQKRVSSGMLHLRAAYLNLHHFVEGRRKGSSPHELLTGEKVGDWLEKLGYSPRSSPVRNFKSLGWHRLVQPFDATWRRNWLDGGLHEALADALDGPAS